MPSQPIGISRIVRYATFSLVGFVLLVTSGCSIEEFLGGGWSVETDDAALATPTRVRPTPIPTNTPWTFVTATPTPVHTSTPTPTQPPTATPSPTPSPTPAPVLLPLLPTLDDMPDDFELTTEDASLTADEAAEGFDNPEQLAARFAALGYEAGAFREFMLPDPGVAEYLTELLGFQATVMQFDTAAHAGEAIAFQREFAKGQPDWDLNDKTVEQIADESAALTGTAVYEGVDVKVVVIFVRDGDLVYRFIAISGAYDAFKDTVRIARETVPA